MGKRLAVATLSTMALLMAGCAMAPVVPPTGAAFSNVKAPISTEYNEQTPVPSKEGETSSACILGLVAWGDASVSSAAQNGNLSQVNYVDYTYLNVLGVYQRFTVTAHGE